MAPQELVDDPLAWIIARFEKGVIHPIRFRWAGRELQVDRVHARWVDRAARPACHYFSVSVSSGEIIELRYQEGDPVWRITRVDLP